MCMKIAIIGASGKVGTETTRLLAEQNVFEDAVDIVLYAPNNCKKIIGQIEDLEESLLIRNKSFSQKVAFDVSNDIRLINNSDMVIVCAGLFATPEEKRYYQLVDSSGRNIQSLKNCTLVDSICYSIKENSPKSCVIMVTNQSDIMSSRARKLLPNQKIFGLGCYLDTLRFKKLFIEEAKKNDVRLSFNEVQATILGFHNENMFLEERSFSVSNSINEIEKLKTLALQRTIIRGKEISDLQKDLHIPTLNSGSSRLPAAAIFNIIEAFTQRKKELEIPLNRLVYKEELKCDDVMDGTSAQMPCIIKQGVIEDIKTELSPKNLEQLRTGIIKFEQEFKMLETSNRISLIKQRSNQNA